MVVTTFGHGLNQAPEIFFLKSKDNSENWRVYHILLWMVQMTLCISIQLAL